MSHWMMPCLLLFTALVMCFGSGRAAETGPATDDRESQSLSSPDGSIEVRFTLEQGTPQFAVWFEEGPLLTPSPLGFHFKNASPLIGGFNIRSVERGTFEEVWKPVWGTVESIHNHYHEMAITLVEEASLNREMKLVFRAFDDGLAFRYVLPEQDGLHEIQILSEETGFSFAGDYSVWWSPADFNSYEHLFKNTPLSFVEAANTPVTLETPRGVTICIHEADLTDYAGMTLRNAAISRKGAVHPSDSIANQTLLCELVPWPDGIKVKGTARLQTPWRTIQVARNPARLGESHLLLNLNEPNRIEDTSWIKPKKYVGIWWGMHIGKWTWHAGPKHGATTDQAKQYIDFAAAHGFPAVLIEGWNRGWESWLSGKNEQDYTRPYPDFGIEGLVVYARERGVEIIGHHETGGNVPHYEEQIDAAFAYYKRLGIRAIKTGYAGRMHPPGQHHHGQWMVRHYRMVVEKAAKYGMMIDAHEPIKDTGISRTWPNMMTREGSRGMEYNAWSEGNPPEHTTVLPFTRLLTGPLDYTPGIFDLTFNEYKPGNRVHTTLARQLAYYVVLYSPLQMAADLVENYENQPAFRFIEDVPADWDDTRFLAAQIGNFVAIARRSGNEWFLGAITDEISRRLELSFDFLDPAGDYVVQIYTDALDTDWEHNPAAMEIGTYRMKGSDKLQAVLPSGGGLAMRIVSAEQSAVALAGTTGELPDLSSFNNTADDRVTAYAMIRPFGAPNRVRHAAIGRPIQITQPWSPKYTAGGLGALVDGLRGGANHDVSWQGYEAVDLEAVIDLGQEQPINTIGAGFLQKAAYWVFFPTEITFAVSSDGSDFETVAWFRPPVATSEDDFAIETVTRDLAGTRARYVRVRARNIGQCPSWHRGAGRKAWLFVDEIIIQ
ncbi:glycoside hydrolase family 97 protein [Candidatus Eisenbacteria bacterium]|uniref:Glycoside hydrolase family 97 protein n=1 Tax=Eiseniibacteriota bacterium TaxID=2212470 RepID=A0ABV6YIT1_UNCEI